MDGIINVLKPPGMTSHDVVQFIRRTLHIRKVGHTGTLDPGVAGVLPICLGKATRVAQFVTDSGKSYRAEVTFGITTSTYDKFSEITGEAETSFLTEANIVAVLNEFRGQIQQVPPMTSAVRHQGKKLYELARAGLEVEREPRSVQISELRPVKFYLQGVSRPRLIFDVSCSKGTYIRTLCHDIGQRLGCGAYMSFLVRTDSGPFLLREAVTVEEIVHLAATDGIAKILHPLDIALQHLPRVWVKPASMASVQNGSKIYPAGIQEMPAGELADQQMVRLYAPEGGCLAVARTMRDQPTLVEGNFHEYVFQPVKVF